ncbi:MAG: hypothetical protein LLG06_03455 [Desulfobacteraceae bacterium]|nr:hypothetical protein [Desulfobacteraceae bacterium]
MHDHSDRRRHDHGAKPAETLSDEAKLRKMVEHWIGHNEEHARSYREWADRARAAGQEGAGSILEEIAAGTIRQNDGFKRILDLLGRSGA